MKLAIFDFDGTLFLTQTLPFFLEQWQALGYSKSRTFLMKTYIVPLYASYKLRLIDSETFRVKALKFFPHIFRGMDHAAITHFFSQVGLAAETYYNPQIVAEIAEKQTQGYHTVILSGCYSLFLNIVAKRFAIDTYLGTELYFNKKTYLDYDADFRMISGTQKLTILKEHFTDQPIDWQESYAYADSFEDLNLLQGVGHPVAVNPDRRLAKYAKKNNWKILSNKP